MKQAGRQGRTATQTRTQTLPQAGDRCDVPGLWEGAEYVSVYTRAQAVADGALVDVTKVGREAGFRRPVAVTRSVWSMIENVPAGSGQDVQGRLWDVLWMAYVAARVNRDKSELLYRLTLTRKEMRETVRGRRNLLVRDLVLKLHVGPGDHGEPVFTISLPSED